MKEKFDKENRKAVGGIVFSGSVGTSMQSSTFPGICVLSDGQWLCTFRSASAKRADIDQHVSICRSCDEGATWSQPENPFRVIDVDGNPGLFRAAYVTELQQGRLLAVLCWVDNTNPELPYFNERTEGILDTKICISDSTDMGITWSIPRLVTAFPYSKVPTPITGPILELPDGRLALQFEVNKPYYETTVWHHNSVIIYSSDGGDTWQESDIVTGDPENRVFYWDQRPGVLSDGSILDMFWTYDNGDTKYLNIHCRKSGNGSSLHEWGKLCDSGIPGQPAQPVDMGDGLIAAVFVDRTSIPAIRAATIRKSESTETDWTDWKVKPGFLYRHKANHNQQDDKHSMNDAWAEMGKFSLGLPAAARIKRDLLVVFYAGSETDKTDIYWIRIPRKDLE